MIDTSARRKLILASATTTLAAVAMVSGGGPVQAEPDQPKKPGEAIEVWVEDFEGDLTDGQLVILPDYAGDNGSYAADPYWQDAGACNGYVMDGMTNDDDLEAAGAGCGREVGDVLRAGPTKLGEIQGAEDPTTNHALVNFSEPGTPGQAGVVAKSAPIKVEGGHYLTVGFNYWAEYCDRNHAELKLAVRYQAADHLLGDVDPCDAPNTADFTAWEPLRAPGDVSELQYVLSNTQTRTDGNDFTVDTLKVLDETPQLDQKFTPSEVNVGKDSTLTYTITNVTGPLGLRAKADFGFRDLLPEGLDVDPRSFDTTCGNGVVTESPKGTVNLEGGDLKNGETTCTVTATVTSDEAGTYENGAVTVAARGLLAPGPAQITFVRGPNPDPDPDPDPEPDPEPDPCPESNPDCFVPPDGGAPAGADNTSAYGWGGVGALTFATTVGGLLWWRRRATS